MQYRKQEMTTARVTICTGYQNCRSYTRYVYSIGEKDFMSCVYDYPCKSFLTPISYQNCV